MNAVVKASVALAVLVFAVSLVLAFAGLHQGNPMVAPVVFLVAAIGLNAVCVFWALKQTAAENGYLKQLVNGLLIGVIAGVLIFALSWLMLSVLMPHYLDEVKTATLEWLDNSPLSAEQIEAQRASVEGTTAVSQALAGLVGTLFTSIILGAILGIFLRKK